MELKKLPYDLTICKVKSELELNLNNEFYFIGKTDEEISLVCITADAPKNAIERDDGWKCFRIQGSLDFSLTGIISEISSTLAENHIAIFAVSTYNTDYVLVKKESFEKSLELLAQQGYSVI